MGKISVKDGAIFLSTEKQQVMLLAEEIFAIIFESALSARGIPLSQAEFNSTGLKFSKYSAAPTVVLQRISEDDLFIIECRLFGKGNGFEAEVKKCTDCDIPDYVIFRNTWMPLPAGSIEAARSFLKEVGLSDFGQISLEQYLRILQFRDTSLLVEDRTNTSLRAAHLAGTLKGDVPVDFMGTLYPYQVDGYRWLTHMKRSGVGCIIADEMGLGKTIQVICLLLDLKQNSCNPSLVVTPATLIESWKRELKRFAPSLDVYVHHGSGRTGFPDELQEHNVILTSYETAATDVSLLRNVTWQLIVADEAQALKNPSAKRTKRLKTLLRRSAVAMSGTPFENRLTDLWSITDFVVPSLLGSQAEFENRFPETMESASSIEPIITPIILRRKVSDVAKDLPERIDIAQPLQLDAETATLYESLRLTAATSGNANLALLNTLRMFCTHPWLSGHCTHISAADCSVKLQRLFEIVEEIVSSDAKTLIFTSYQKAADLLSREIASQFNIYTDVIDGRTPVSERQQKIDDFINLRSAAALILNPRAAGTGLNITAASHVIHFNLEWNPAVEDQASARAYRLGQTKIVTIHRLFYIDTVEDVINDRLTRKRELASTAVIGTDGSDADMQDILKALRVSPLNQGRRHNDGSNGNRESAQCQ